MTNTPTDPGQDERDALDAARQHELTIADRADEARGEPDDDADLLGARMFDNLYPLLREAIPPAYIVHTPKGTGKPYASTGIRSVQVQIDRMNNVFGPRWWWQEIRYENEGRLCTVQILVGNRVGPQGMPEVYASAECTGGVDRGSSQGNVHKGSYTNAAKRAFAMLGVGHEVYLGDLDLDPDVNTDLAVASAKAAGGDGAADAEPVTIPTAQARKIVDKAWAVGGAAKADLQRAASFAASRDVGDCGTKAKAVKAIATLSYTEAEKVEAWIGTKGEAS